VYGSLDNGSTWTDLSTKVSGTTLTWDGVTLSGSSTLLLRVTDAAGNNGSSASQTYTYDASVPAAPASLALSNASNSGSLSDNISNDSTPTISGSGEANATVTLYEGSTVLGSTTADGSGNWSITSSSLSEGTHNLSAKQTDLAGNVSPASGTLAYQLDVSAPTSMALSATTVNLSAATNGLTIATISSHDTTTVSYSFATGTNGVDADNAKFTISGTSLVAAQTLSVGSYHIYLSGTDQAGNETDQAYTITVTDAPMITAIARANSASSTVPAAATSLDYTVTFDQSVTGVDVSDFSLTGSGTATGSIASISGSGASYTITVNNISGDGTLRLDLNGSGTGIQSGSSVAIASGYTGGESYTLDHTPPAAPSTPAMTSATDSGSSSSDAITSHTTPNFNGTADANASVTLYEGSTVLGTTTANGSGNWTITSSALSAGTHLITAKQTDAAGNVSLASSALTVRIDTSAAAPATPTLASASDSGTLGDHITNVTTPIVTGTAEANASVTLYDSDGSTVLGTTSADGSGVWSIQSSTLSSGSHTLTVKQTDVAGNTSAASSGMALTIDISAPAAPGTPVLDSASDTDTLGDNHTYISTPVLTGTGEANATIKLYDSNGSTLLGTATVDGTGHWSITSNTLTIGQHTLTVQQSDAAGNVSPVSAALVLTIEAAPVPSTPPVPIIDGVPVTTQPITLPGGGSGNQIVIPVVPSGRVDSSGNGSVADIPLVTNGASNVLLAQLPTGYGLSTTGGDSQPAGNSLEHLIQAIVAATPDHPVSDQSHLTGNGVTFLNQLAATVPLLVQTLVPSTGNTTPTGALTLTGTSTSQQHTALVIDTSQMAAGSKLMLQQVDFAAIIGAADVTGNTNGQILTGDAASQHFTVSSSSGSSVFSGGGDDILAVSVPPSARGTAQIQGAAQPGTTLLHGGLGNDTVVFSGARAAYTLDYHDGYVVVSANAQPTQHMLVLNAERLAFSDTAVSVQNRAVLNTITGLYHDILGRQGDYLGVEFWATAEKQGVSLGKIALSMISSAELQATPGKAFNGDATHDVELLYQTIFSRHSDAEGLAFWSDKISHGMTLEQVAQYFVTAGEMEVHKIAPQNWDFLV